MRRSHHLLTEGDQLLKQRIRELALEDRTRKQIKNVHSCLWCCRSSCQRLSSTTVQVDRANPRKAELARKVTGLARRHTKSRRVALNGPKSLLSRIGRRLRKASASIEPSASIQQRPAGLFRPRSKASNQPTISVQTTLLRRMHVKGRPLMNAFRRDGIKR